MPIDKTEALLDRCIDTIQDMLDDLGEVISDYRRESLRHIADRIGSVADRYKPTLGDILKRRSGP